MFCHAEIYNENIKIKFKLTNKNKSMSEVLTFFKIKQESHIKN